MGKEDRKPTRQFSPRDSSEINTFPLKIESSPRDLDIKNRGWVPARTGFFERGRVNSTLEKR